MNDLGAAMRDAKDAAGDKNVLVHGAGITQRALKAGLLDELEIHLIPILMGEGRRLFEHLGVEQRELERVRVLEGEAGVIHLRYPGPPLRASAQRAAAYPQPSSVFPIGVLGCIGEEVLID